MISHWHKGAEALVGYRREEAIGQRLGLIVPEHLQEARILALANTAAQRIESASSGVTGRVHIGFTAIAGHAHLHRFSASRPAMPDILPWWTFPPLTSRIS